MIAIFAVTLIGLRGFFFQLEQPTLIAGGDAANIRTRMFPAISSKDAIQSLFSLLDPVQHLDWQPTTNRGLPL